MPVVIISAVRDPMRRSRSSPTFVPARRCSRRSPGARLTASANFVSGGTGAPFNFNKYVAELNAHIQLPAGLAFEPVFQYAWNLNSFYNPLTAARPRDGIFLCGVLIVPVGALLGLVPS